MNKKDFRAVLNLGLQLKEKESTFVDLTFSMDSLLESALNLYLYSIKGFIYQTQIDIVKDDVTLIEGATSCCVSYTEFCKAVDKSKVKDGIKMEVSQSGLTVNSGTFSMSIPAVSKSGVRMKGADKMSAPRSFEKLDVMCLKNVRQSFTVDALSALCTRIHFFSEPDALVFYATTGAGVCAYRALSSTTSNDCQQTFSFPCNYAKNFSFFEGKMSCCLSLKKLSQRDVYHLVVSDDKQSMHLPLELDSEPYADNLKERMQMKGEGTPVLLDASKELIKAIKDYRKKVREISGKSDKFDTLVCLCPDASGKSSTFISLFSREHIPEEKIGKIEGVKLDLVLTSFDFEWFLSNMDKREVGYQENDSLCLFSQNDYRLYLAKEKKS